MEQGGEEPAAKRASGPRVLNDACLMFISCVKVVESLTLTLGYVSEMINNDHDHYSMEDMTMLPEITSMHLILRAKGHSFGACTFHILRLCPGIKQLPMDLSDCFISKAQAAECPPGCICGQPPNWKTEELTLNCLQFSVKWKSKSSEGQSMNSIL
ncbi:unnamed protein product [Urochloa humidicola]